VKKRAKKGLKFVAATKVLENRGERVSKTNKPINKKAVHWDYWLLRQLADIACRYMTTAVGT
jgi:hypothetical protein